MSGAQPVTSGIVRMWSLRVYIADVSLIATLEASERHESIV
jgi:hypothetical protein